jgi:hypothetical protein
MNGGWVGTGRVLVIAGVLLTAALTTPADAEPLVIGFESVTPRDPGNENYWTPNPGFTVAGTLFSGGSYNGFVVSSSTTTGVAGYLGYLNPGEAEISAQSNGGAGGGADGSKNFAVAYDRGSYIDLPVGYRPASVDLTNTATAYYAILNGLYYATGFPILGHPEDWFRVTFTGYSATGGTGSQTGVPVDFYLADYREGRSLVVESWKAVDLSPLGEARSIVLSFASTDSDPVFGSNTPAYVALDNLTLMAVPEPGAATLAAVGAAWCLLRRRRRRAGRVSG